MKKSNVIFICAVLIVSVGLWFALKPSDTAGEKWAEIMVDGKLKGRYSLSENCVVDIDQKNQLVIQEGKADMTDADCPDKLCVNHPPVSKIGETIVCLPNRVVVTIVGSKSEKMDIIVQ